MVVMLLGQCLIARPTLAEIMALDDAGILEELYGAINGRDRDVWIDGGGAAIKLLDVRVIVGGWQHARDDAALLGHPHALLGAELFKGGLRFVSHDALPPLRHVSEAAAP